MRPQARRWKVWYGDIQEGIILNRNLLFNALMSSMLVLICHTPLSTAQTSQAKEPPLPGPIILAKKVFVANGGEDPVFNFKAGRSYSQLYAGLKNWGHYEVVSSPSDADLSSTARGQPMADKRR